jgi:hypothetical protein
MRGAASRLSQLAAFARAHGVKLGLEVMVNFLLPFAIYSYAGGRLGAPQALMAASTPPILWSIGEFIRERKVDALSILVLTGIVLSLLAFAGGGGVKVLQLRENLVAGLVGLIFLGSAAVRKPLIYQLSRAATRRGSAEKIAAFEALGSDPRFRSATTVATLVWGFGLVAVCAVSCALVFIVSIKQYLLINGPISYSALGLLTVWTYWYVPRAMRRVQGARDARR